MENDLKLHWDAGARYIVLDNSMPDYVVATFRLLNDVTQYNGSGIRARLCRSADGSISAEWIYKLR